MLRENEKERASAAALKSSQSGKDGRGSATPRPSREDFAPSGGAKSPLFSARARKAGVARGAAPVASVVACPPLSNRGVRCGNSRLGFGKIAGVRFNDMKFVASADGGSSFALFGSWSGNFLNDLETWKNSLREKGSTSGEVLRFGCFSLSLYSFGVRPGSGAFPAAYILDYTHDEHGLHYKIYISKEPVDGLPCCSVQIHYAALRACSIYDCIQHVKEFLSGLGLTITRTTISRLDVNVSVNIPMEYFYNEMKHGRVFTSSKKRRFITRGDKIETFDCGSRGDSVVVRVYDKIRELQAHFDGLKIEDLQNQFGDSSSVTRFEFEFCRRVLRDHNINDEEDLIDGLSGLLTWTLTKVFRMSARKSGKNDRHIERSGFSPFFQLLSKAFLEFASCLAPGFITPQNVSYVRFIDRVYKRRSPRVVKRAVRSRAKTVLKAGVSTVVNALSRLSTSPLSFEKLMRVLFDVFYKNNLDFYNRYRMRFAYV